VNGATIPCLDEHRLRLLLVPECLDRVEVGGADGRIEAGRETDGGADSGGESRTHSLVVRTTSSAAFIQEKPFAHRREDDRPWNVA
jgi:hypothetical protein